MIKEYSCWKCLKDFHEDDIIWSDEKGNLTTMTGYPYCMACLPEEPDVCNECGFYLWDVDSVPLNNCNNCKREVNNV